MGATTKKIDQWMTRAAKQILQHDFGYYPEHIAEAAKIIASHAPSEALMSQKDEQIIDWLVKERAFTPKAARKCLTTFKETMKFAGINLPSEAAAQPKLSGSHTAFNCVPCGGGMCQSDPTIKGMIEHNDH